MPELAKPNMPELVTELLSAIRPHFATVRADLSPCPNLGQAPWNLPVNGLGQQVYIVPDSISTEEAIKQIPEGHLLATNNGFHVVSDGKSPPHVLRLMLSGPRGTSSGSGGNATSDWRQPIRAFLNAKLGRDAWAMLLACKGSIELLRPEEETEGQKKDAKEHPRDVMVWMAPVTRRIVAGSTKKVVKKKVLVRRVRKDSKSSTPEKSESGPTENGVNGCSTSSIADSNPSESSTLSIGDAAPKKPLTNGTSTPKADNASASKASNAEVKSASASRTANAGSKSMSTSRTSEPEAAKVASASQKSEPEAAKVASESERPEPEAAKVVSASRTSSDTEVKGISISRMLEIETAKAASASRNSNDAEVKGVSASRIISGNHRGSPATEIPVARFGADESEEEEEELSKAASGTQQPAERNCVNQEAQNSGSGTQRAALPTSTTAKNATTDIGASMEQRKKSLEDGTVTELRMSNGVISTQQLKEIRNTQETNATPPVAAPQQRANFPPQSPDSPPSPTGSDSYHSALSGAGGGNRRFRREDAPSPSLSLLQQQQSPATVGASTRRGSNGANGTQRLLLQNGGSLIGSQQLNILSPISSCGSVSEREEQDDIGDQRHLRSTRDDNTTTMTMTTAGGDDDEDETTLALLRGGSADRSMTGGAELLELDDLSIRDDFSLMSTLGTSSQALPPLSTFAAAGGSTTMTTAGAGGRTSSSLLLTTTQASASAGRGFAASSRRASARHQSSPSPPTKGEAHNSLTSPPALVRGMQGNSRLPVPVLLQTLGLFSYKEMGEMRRVHPHWDELCGQLLNQGYYQLLGRAQRMLSECQRKLNREPRLAQPIQLLTRIHVHVLNPVDSMRSFMDEGVLCFPYGALLDQALSMLGRIEEMVAGVGEQLSYDEADVLLDQLQELARRASVHYRHNVEPEAEKRMTDLYKFSAQQRLQRLDSFLVETSMSRVERESEKAREEVRWELEQLKAQNGQLKKENRELKGMCVRMDARLEVLERKFKTMARLLQ